MNHPYKFCPGCGYKLIKNDGYRSDNYRVGLGERYSTYGNYNAYRINPIEGKAVYWCNRCGSIWFDGGKIVRLRYSFLVPLRKLVKA